MRTVFMKWDKRKILIGAVFACLSVLFVWAQVWLSVHENQTIDEGVHLSAGYSYLVTNDFRLNPEHPPLAKEIAALPLLAVRPNLPTDSSAWEQADQWSFAHIFLYESGNNPDTILLLTRLPIILMSLILGLFIARWAYKLGSIPAAFVAFVAYGTSPVILTHGHLVTTDIPVALGAFAAAYFFWESIISRRTTPVIATALSIAFAVNVKFTGLILFVLLPLAYLWIFMFKRQTYPHLGLAHGAKLLSFSLIASFLLSFIITGGTTQTVAEDPYLGTKHLTRAYELPINYPETPASFVHGYTWVLEHVPFPAYPYATGLIEFITHLEGGHESYFLGNYSDFGNVWYFPVAFLVKTRLAILVLLSLILTLFVKRSIATWKYQLEKKNVFKKIIDWIRSFSVHGFLLAFLPVVFLLSTLTSKVNIGVRHILIMYPFLFVGVSLLWSLKMKRGKPFKIVISCILAVGIFSTVFIWPFPMAYFSESIGGAPQGYRYMLDSNLDWGQNLKYLKSYLDTNKIPFVCFGYFGQGDAQTEGISVRPRSPTRKLLHAQGYQTVLLPPAHRSSMDVMADLIGCKNTPQMKKLDMVSIYLTSEKKRIEKNVIL